MWVGRIAAAHTLPSRVTRRREAKVMLSLFSALLLITEAESHVGWPVFVLVMAGVFVIDWIFNVLASRALKGSRRRKRPRSVYKN